MDEYRHHVSGFFAHRTVAEGAIARLVERGMPRDQIQLFDADSGPVVAEPKGESNPYWSPARLHQITRRGRTRRLWVWPLPQVRVCLRPL